VRVKRGNLRRDDFIIPKGNRWIDAGGDHDTRDQRHRPLTSQRNVFHTVALNGFMSVSLNRSSMSNDTYVSGTTGVYSWASRGTQDAKVRENDRRRTAEKTNKRSFPFPSTPRRPNRVGQQRG
jgi:hypothetical protein